MQAAHTVYTYAPHTIRDAGFWTERWKVSLLFSPEGTASVMSNKNVTFGLVWP